LAGIAANANTLVLEFESASDETAPAVKAARVDYAQIPASEYDETLMRDNVASVDGKPSRPTILLSRDHPGGANLVDFLRSVMVLKEILRLNKNLPQRISEFYDGREIVYPTDQELRSNYHVVDAEAARLFFEVQQYYPAFQCSFNQGMRAVEHALDPEATLGPPPTCVPMSPGSLVKIEKAPAAGRKSVGRIRRPADASK
jgi:hypothetical protein